MVCGPILGDHYLGQHSGKLPVPLVYHGLLDPRDHFNSPQAALPRKPVGPGLKSPATPPDPGAVLAASTLLRGFASVSPMWPLSGGEAPGDPTILRSGLQSHVPISVSCPEQDRWQELTRGWSSTTLRQAS